MTSSRAPLIAGSFLALGGIVLLLMGMLALLGATSIRRNTEATGTALAQVVTQNASTQVALLNTLTTSVGSGPIVIVVTATPSPEVVIASDTPPIVIASATATQAPTPAPTIVTNVDQEVVPVINQEVQGANLLVNGGMDGLYRMQCSARGGAPWVAIPCSDPVDYNFTILWQTVQVPVGWVAWWRPPNEDVNAPDYYTFPNRCPDGAPIGCVVWHNPEYRDTAGGPQVPLRKVASDNSLKYFTFYSVHEAGVYQRVVGIQPEQRVRFSIQIQAWSTNDNDAFHSAGQQTMGLRVGIDPYGGDNPWSSNIVWSTPGDAYDQWQVFSIETTAKSNALTVFTRSAPVYPLQHNDVYLDEASLVALLNVPAGVQ